MKDILDTYTALAKDVNNKAEKMYKGKMKDEELEDEIRCLYLEASVKTKNIYNKLVALLGLNEQTKELLDDVKDATEGEIEFLFEDTEHTFNEIIKANCWHESNLHSSHSILQLLSRWISLACHAGTTRQARSRRDQNSSTRHPQYTKSNNPSKKQMIKSHTKQISSIFMQHFNQLMEIQSCEELKNKIKEIVNTSSINQLDKRKITIDISPLESLRSLQFYLTNSMLKYGGMGVR